MNVFFLYKFFKATIKMLRLIYKMATIVVLATILVLGHKFLFNKDNDLLTIADLQTHLSLLRFSRYVSCEKSSHLRVQKSIFKTETTILLSTFVLSLRSRFLWVMNSDSMKFVVYWLSQICREDFKHKNHKNRKIHNRRIDQVGNNLKPHLFRNFLSNFFVTDLLKF